MIGNANVLKFRWFTCNCYQFALPGGKTVVIDPMLVPESFDIKLPHGYCGFTAEDLESADYVILNHTHIDHVASLPEVHKLYNPRILCHSACAAQLSLDFDLPQTSIFPFDNSTKYDFGDFKLATLTGRHNGNWRPSERQINVGTRYERLNQLGTLYNTNFILETPNHVRVGICAGIYRDGEVEKNAWKDADCNIFIRQFGGYLNRNDPEGLAKEFMETGASILLPLHQEKFYDRILPADLEEMASQVNKILKREGYHGYMVNPKRGKWYQIGLTTCCEYAT